MNKLDLCKQCKKREFDFKQGVFCSLTKEKPAFEDNCPEFERDETVKAIKESLLRPNGQRANLLLTFIWIVLGLEIISLISSGLQYNLLQTVINGGTITNEAADANDIREAVIAIVYLIAYIISGVFFIMWFRRAYFNLHQKVEALSCDEGWAVGCWFVPVVNLFRPYLIMKELYEETKKLIPEKIASTYTALSTKYLWLWWTFWIVNGIIGQLIFSFSRHTVTLSDFKTTTILDLIGAITGIALGFVTIKVIKDYAKVEGLLETED